MQGGTSQLAVMLETDIATVMNGSPRGVGMSVQW